MDQKTMTVKCIRCQKQFLLLEMVMDASGKGMSCRPCAGLPPKGTSTTTISSGGPRGVSGATSEHPTAREQFAKPKSPKSSSGKYACLNCHYRFGSSKGPDTISCPYCGSKRISTPEENSADAILRDAGRKDYDF